MAEFNKTNDSSEASATRSAANMKANMEAERKKLIDEIGMQDMNLTDKDYEERKHELQHALAQHYWTKQYSMPLSPLIPQLDDRLSKFYVAFKMKKVDAKSETIESVDSYKSLFYTDNNFHKNVYIQGDAVVGKSIFCKTLGLVWSEKHLLESSKKDSSINKSIRKPKHAERQFFSDESVMNEFDFVFSLALRDVNGECEIEKIIETQIISSLLDHTKYAGLVQKILDKERCLIILDGLDEWSHQRSLCEKSRLVPHRKSWNKTTVLTSTRTWKMNEVRLRDLDISTLFQITGIKDPLTFTENVLNCLNDQYNTTHHVRDFIRYMENKKLKHFLDKPVLATQLLWLWHSGHDIGDSRCKIYMNMLDMLFGRAEEKAPSASDNPTDGDDPTDTPKAGLSHCLENTRFSKQRKLLLDCLGSLAFHTLHSSKRAESLVFSESIMKSHLKSTAVFKTALTTGILLQHRSPSLITTHLQFSFLHKTFQQFLAAYFVATHVDELENIVQTLFQVYGQTVDIMDISEVFIFVCGLNTEMSSKISNSVMKSFSVKLTNHIEELHVSGGLYNVEDMTRSLQEMILAGYNESISNGNQDPQLALHHVYYGSDIPDDGKIFRDRLVDLSIDKIVTLCAGTVGETCTVDVVKIQQILTQSSSTLSHVRLERVEGLADSCLDLFTITLKSLRLSSINTHFDIKLNTSSLLYCDLRQINKEVEHSVMSALTAAPQLHTLEVRDCKNMPVLCQVLPTLPILHRLGVQDSMIPASLCQVLSTLSQLQRLAVHGDCEDPSLLCLALSTLSQLQGLTVDGHYEDPSLLCRALSTLSNLQYIHLLYTDLGDNDILLPSSIQDIVLDWVALTCRSCRQLVDRLTQIPHQVTCRLEYCTVEPVEERDTIMKYIEQSDMFEIHSYDGCGGIILNFTKLQT